MAVQHLNWGSIPSFLLTEVPPQLFIMVYTLLGVRYKTDIAYIIDYNITICKVAEQAQYSIQHKQHVILCDIDRYVIYTDWLIG